MANEISVSSSWSINKAVVFATSRSATISQSGNRAYFTSYQIDPASPTGWPERFGGLRFDSTGTALADNDPTSIPRYVLVFNASTFVSTSDRIDLCFDSAKTQPFMSLAPGELSVFRPTINPMYVAAYGNTQRILICAVGA